MFEELTNQFEDAVKAFKGEAKISDENVDEALKQVTSSLRS
jgi:signal recognition particle subunit SRP54